MVILVSSLNTILWQNFKNDYLIELCGVVVYFSWATLVHILAHNNFFAKNILLFFFAILSMCIDVYNVFMNYLYSDTVYLVSMCG